MYVYPRGQTVCETSPILPTFLVSQPTNANQLFVKAKEYMSECAYVWVEPDEGDEFV